MLLGSKIIDSSIALTANYKGPSFHVGLQLPDLSIDRKVLTVIVLVLYSKFEGLSGWGQKVGSIIEYLLDFPIYLFVKGTLI